jgi:hypothetical protein
MYQCSVGDEGGVSLPWFLGAWVEETSKGSQGDGYYEYEKMMASGLIAGR